MVLGHAIGGDPQHVRDAIVEPLALSALLVHVTPCVVHRCDSKAGEVACEQLEHGRYSVRGGKICFHGACKLVGALGFCVVGECRHRTVGHSARRSTVRA